MKVVIAREYEDKETRGLLLVFDGTEIVFQCKTLELPDKGNAKKVSCIPEGVYEVVKALSPTKGKCFMINKVPNRDSILIHIGNYATGVKVDTLGCILPGMSFTDINKDGYLDVADSTGAMKKLLELLPDKFELNII